MDSADRIAMGLEMMLNELQSHQLITVLVPCKRECNVGGCYRVNVSENPKWYRSLCERHTSSRKVRRGKQDTIIRRHRIEQTLKTMIDGRKPRSIYVHELRQIASKFKIHALSPSM